MRWFVFALLVCCLVAPGSASAQEASFIDGVRIEHQDGWVLVLPDEHRPQMHVIAEALSDDEARRMAEGYRDKLEAWKPSQSA